MSEGAALPAFSRAIVPRDATPDPAPPKRTGGMLVVGLLDIIFGTLGALVSIVFIVAGILQAAEVETPLYDLMWRYGWITSPVWTIMVGVARLASSAILVVAGVRVMDVAPAGRRLSLAAIVSWSLINVAEMYARNFSIVWFGWMTIYPAILDLLFMKKSWRAAFG